MGQAGGIDLERLTVDRFTADKLGFRRSMLRRQNPIPPRCRKPCRFFVGQPDLWSAETNFGTMNLAEIFQRQWSGT